MTRKITVPDHLGRSATGSLSLGKGKRKVCPSCVVKTIRTHYPSQTGVYMGFRHE